MSPSPPIMLVLRGSRGIGATCVAALAQGGWQVAYTYVSHAAEGSAGKGYAADIRDAAVARVFDQVEADFGARPLPWWPVPASTCRRGRWHSSSRGTSASR